MKIFESSIYNASLSAEASYIPLTDEQKTILKKELTEDPKNRGYKDKEVKDILWLLGNEYTEENKEKQGTIPITEWNRDELYNVLLQATTASGVPVLIAIEELQKNDNIEIVMLARQAKMTLDAPLKAINFENPKVAQGFGALKQLGVLTDEVYNYITTKPDPNYQSVLPPKRRLWELFGEGAIVTLDEIKEILT